MKVWKMNGTGNTFAIIDARNKRFSPSKEEIKKIASDMQADQVLSLNQDTMADTYMMIWNSDGSQVQACGNGTRAVGHLLLDEISRPTASIRTDAGNLEVSRASEGHVTVDMGEPVMAWDKIPLSREMNTDKLEVEIEINDEFMLAGPSAVSMGNPHAVFFVEDIDDIDIMLIGPVLEKHPVFPEYANIGFAQVFKRNVIRLRVWERGAGLTKACGTGACAALVCAARTGRTDREAKLILDGGELQINWRASNNHVLMTGSVELEYEATL